MQFWLKSTYFTESTLADLREVFPTTRLQQAVDGQIHDTDIEPVGV